MNKAHPRPRRLNNKHYKHNKDYFHCYRDTGHMSSPVAAAVNVVWICVYMLGGHLNNSDIKVITFMSELFKWCQLSRWMLLRRTQSLGISERPCHQCAFCCLYHMTEKSEGVVQKRRASC